MGLSSHRLKKILILQEEPPKPENQKFSIFCLWRKNFSNITQKKKVSYTSPYKEAKFSKDMYRNVTENYDISKTSIKHILVNILTIF